MSELEHVKFQELKELPLSEIDVADENVRKTERSSGIDELAASIESFGLLQPVIVLRKGDRYKLIVGQRRLLAFKQLKKQKIPALIIDTVDETTQVIASLAENLQRRQLPFKDTVTVCRQLFSEYPGSKKDRIEKIAQQLGIGVNSVSRYLADDLIPDTVKDMVQENRISRPKAEALTSAFWPDVKKIEAIAKQFIRLTKAEKDRITAYVKSHPDASVEETIYNAKNPHPSLSLVLPMEQKLVDALREHAESRGTDIPGLIMSIISEWLEQVGPAK